MYLFSPLLGKKHYEIIFSCFFHVAIKLGEGGESALHR